MGSMERPRREKKAKVDVSALNALSNAKRGVVSRKEQHQVRVAIAYGGYAQRVCTRGQPVSFARAAPPGRPAQPWCASGRTGARTPACLGGAAVPARGSGVGGRGTTCDQH